MLLHIGNGRSVRGEEIIGIFDLDNATISQESRAYLSAATRAGEVSYSDSDIPRSFLVIAKKNRGAGDDRAQQPTVGGGALDAPHPTPSIHCRGGVLAAARSRRGSDSPPDCHSLPRRRFATPPATYRKTAGASPRPTETRAAASLPLPPLALPPHKLSAVASIHSARHTSALFFS